MANWRYHSKLRINPYAPTGRGCCDRCSQTINHSDLIWEMEYRGNSLMRTGFLVCKPCLDVPYQGNRPILLPADPVPFLNPRTEPLLQEENQGPMTLVGGTWDGAGELWDNNLYWDQEPNQ